MNIKVPSYLKRLATLALASAPFAGPQLQAEEVYSQIVGAIALDIPADSDVVVSFPFKQSSSYGGRVHSVSGAELDVGDGVSILSSGDFDAVGGQATHYVLVEDGSLEGRHFDIVSNTDQKITLDTSENLSGLDQAIITVREHWTLGEAFPNGIGSNAVFEASGPQVQLLVPEEVKVGGGFDVASLYYFYQGAWRAVGEKLDLEANGANSNDDVIAPGASVMVRNNSMDDIRTYFFGEVVTSPIAIPIESSSSDVVDNYVSVSRPLGLTLAEFGLSAGGAFTASTSLAEVDRGDLLLVYSYTESGKNKTADQYFLYNNEWYLAGGDGTPVSDTVIKAGQGVVIRKKAGEDGVNYWTNNWSLDS
ncbi:TIGR02597 family protein [Pelagicoccus sp. SDUM812003]|uniref:TIGR02597 family protein n=1 Tax=Pelagicoccus sp. SDUM812003 TaxID=3041267 RepID=UPI00280FE529|nr:TIGR02597 family protein [Pelagicoccus sp. SDUM812003]MDQ8202506.1 TIGR02597 family protein [Pelagicoccus sp. SDUM812003]